MENPTSSQPNLGRLLIEVRGVVQGVGFRPFVYNLARSLGLVGWVQNEAHTVRIEVQGGRAELDRFCRVLQDTHPPQSRIDSFEATEVPCHREPSNFEIRASSSQGAPGPAIPADLATCADCLEEIRSPAERRYRYPFTNCTNCGPRWSIVSGLPYDRPRTSMVRFEMCRQCRAEYRDPTDRRFHAQPIACPECGPILQLIDSRGVETASGENALDRTVDAICDGQIVAVKGLGGFQLLVDATDAEAVARLRRRKRRPDKPFALMLSSLDEIRRRCEVSRRESQSLSSHQAPILLLPRRSDAGTFDDVAAETAPGNPYLGVMLPYTPLHHLLMDGVGRPIVCTSGNLSEEPMAITTGEALERLGSIADLFLVHDRPIVRPVDDSVARIAADGLQLLRRARGYAPLPIDTGHECPVILAVGGHMKNTIALSLGSQAIVGSHIGDLETAASVEVHRRAVRDLVEFFQVVPEVVACDLHPDYASTRHAEQLAAEWDVPLVRVQHHHAHVAACMAERQLEGPVLGFAWDGAGYGPDGTVWGGEVLECDGAGFRRLAHLRTFPLPGGDKAAREPRRSALGLLFEFLGPEVTCQLEGNDTAKCADDWFGRSELRTLLSVLKRPHLNLLTSSMGRLFDAVAALCGFAPIISFEGQAAMGLEFAADVEEQEAYPLSLSDGTPQVVNWEPLVRAVLSDLTAGVRVGQISARFHNALADVAVAVARGWKGRQVVLSGGCFQNRLLAERVRTRLSEAGFSVYTHLKVPPGDGGIALGQLAIAAKRSRGT